MVLEIINNPGDLKELSSSELSLLAKEIRKLLVDVVKNNGGHLASNLGIVELTIALHRVFDFSKDSLVFDVGHQCYTHKILSGRRELFSTLRQKNGMSGFPNPNESRYDLFISGHSSTSISSATGLALGKKIRGDNSSTVALVGDGSLGGGMCFEAMNHAGGVGADLLVVLNDNDMAISRTVGAFVKHLEEFRSRENTTKLRNELKELFSKLPLIGDSMDWLYEKVLSELKNHTGAAAVFEAMGFRYFGPFDGHDIEGMEEELGNLSRLSGPRILHVLTEKGKGFKPAHSDPESFHSSAPFVIDNDSGDILKTCHEEHKKSYSEAFSEIIYDMAGENDKLVAITAAMTGGTGMAKFAEDFNDRFFDVGMAESHAIPFAAGLAKVGFVPIVAIYSTFLQRSYDQIFHDIALQENLPVIFALDRAGLVGEDGPTHHGIFDIAYMRHLPNMVLMAPADEEDMRLLLDFASTLKSPSAIRYPRGKVGSFLPKGFERREVELGKGEVLREGGDGTVLAYGRMVEPVYSAATRLEEEKGIKLAVVNARFAKPLDKNLISESAQRGIIFTVEDHALAGGFGSAVGEYLLDNYEAEITLIRIGIEDKFVRAASRNDQDEELGLSEDRLFARFIEEFERLV